MRLAVTTEHRFDRTPDGHIWTASVFPYQFWLRYLEVFDAVTVVGRVRDVSSVPGTHQQVDGDKVSIFALPHYQGPAQFARMAPRVIQTARMSIAYSSAAILRVPSLLATLAESTLVHRHQPYGVEVVGDPCQVFAPGSIVHPLRPLFRWWSTRAQKRQCWNAVGAAYVTRAFLQRNYPCKALQMAISDVEISELSFVATPRVFDAHCPRFDVLSVNEGTRITVEGPSATRVRLILVGSLEQSYKATDIVIAALAQLVKMDYDLELVVVGDGKYRGEFETLAQDLGISDRIEFRGMLPAGDAIRAELDVADLFVLPSRTEGLPRAMIEAMARGLPCIGSTVGGIPELLPIDDLVPPGDVAALADKIREVIVTPGRMQAMSERNLRKAHEYHTDILEEYRRQFYLQIRRATEGWLGAKRP